MVRQRVRIRFCKQGDLRLIGHRDLMRSFERLFRRAELPLGMSQGFHPKPRMTFPLPLAVGIEGIDEVMELELSQPCTAEDVLHRLTTHTVPELIFSSVEVLPEGSRKGQVRATRYQLPIPSPHQGGLMDRIDRFLAASTFPIERPKRPASLDLRPLVEELTFEQGVLEFRLRCEPESFARPQDVLKALDLPEIEQLGVYATRTAVEIG